MDQPHTIVDRALFEDYQRELESLETFRERYRHLYPFAGLDRDDPDVQRLLEGLAFFTARTRRAADHALARYERRALEQVFPYLITPLPSMAMLTVDASERMIEPHTLPRGSELAVAPRAPSSVPGQPAPALRFRTTRELVVRPFDLDRAALRLVRIGDEGYELTVPIRSTTPRSEAVGELELALDPHGDLLAALRLHHALAHHAVSASYRFPGTTQPDRRCSIGFAPRDHEDDGFANPLEQLRARIHFPLAALVVRLAIDQTPSLWQRLEIKIRLAASWPRELSVPPGALVLHAVPIINLHRELADPMPLDGTAARLEVVHPEPVRALRPRELLAVYRADRGGLSALAPEALAGADDDWYAAEVEGRHALRRLWLDVHAPGAFSARAQVVADVEWYDPDAGRILAGALDARLTARHLDGTRWRVLTPIVAGLDSPLAGRRDRLHRLLALAGRSDLDAPSFAFLLDALGCADHPLFQRVTRAITRLDVSRQADARAPSGVRTTFALTLGELPRALVPAADVLLSRLPDLIAAWSGDAQPIVRVQIAVDGDDFTTLYRSEALP